MKEYAAPTKDTVRALVELFKSGESLTVAQLNEKVQEKFTPGHLLALVRRGFVDVTKAKGLSGEINSYIINDDGWDFLEDHYLDNMDNHDYMIYIFGTEEAYGKWNSEHNPFHRLLVQKML